MGNGRKCTRLHAPREQQQCQINVKPEPRASGYGKNADHLGDKGPHNARWRARRSRLPLVRWPQLWREGPQGSVLWQGGRKNVVTNRASLDLTMGQLGRVIPRISAATRGCVCLRESGNLVLGNPVRVSQSTSRPAPSTPNSTLGHLYMGPSSGRDPWLVQIKMDAYNTHPRRPPPQPARDAQGVRCLGSELQHDGVADHTQE